MTMTHDELRHRTELGDLVHRYSDAVTRRDAPLWEASGEVGILIVWYDDEYVRERYRRGSAAVR